MTEPFYNSKTNKIKLAQQGNKEALDLLCKQYEGLIRKYAHASAVKCEAEDMENLLWELFLRAIKEYNTEGTVPFSGFVQSRIRYGQYNAFKKLRRQWQHESLIMNTTTDGEDSAMTFEDIIDPTDSAEDTVVNKQSKIQIAKAFHRLPEPQQQLLYSYYVDNIPLAELARQHGISRQAMQQHKNRALTALTVYFNDVSHN
ncbi:RNA polymerase sigma factor [Veillonella sp. R32]|uniref:RNA polymerase sigma factor n=1 Tax=Veillonella sp. R32 TaxID=2021312 RepID=UPI00138A02B2|nr:sigma-70 family RNA polymerase sigma factor [Veillonella sp. R32]KAF1683574.1 hypothetical protein VER_01645 [Veillonella sp. R32]